MKKLLWTGAMLVAFAAPPAHATLTLNSAGVADGFTLSQFFTGGSDYDDLSNAVMSDGSILAVDFRTQQILKYPDTDGRTLTGGTGPTASASLANAIVAASVGGNTYVGILGGGFDQVSTSLVATPYSFGSLPGHTYGVWADPSRGTLLGAFGTQIYELNPTTHSNRLVTNTGNLDGVTVSPDGTIVYGEINGNEVVGYNIATGALVFDTGIINGGPDGTGVIAGGPLAGDVVINNNDGTVALVKPNGSDYTIIASGGTRGDFTSADTSNGTLFLASTDTTYRLGLTSGSIGGSVPEPASLSVLGAALAGLGMLRRRR